MATVKIPCPKCSGFGITGTVQEAICSQCGGKGYITQDDTQTLAVLNATAAATGTPIVVTAAVKPPVAALKVAVRGS